MMMHTIDQQINSVARRRLHKIHTQIVDLLKEDFPGRSKLMMVTVQELLIPIQEYILKRTYKPSTQKIQSIILKLNEIVVFLKRKGDDELIVKIRTCGAVIKEYLDSIDPEHTLSLRWENNWIVPVIKEIPQESMLSDMRHLLDGWNIEQNVKYNGHVSFLDS
jgi:hypothetical protein